MFYDGDTDLEELEKDGALQEAIILVVGGSSRDADGVLVDNGASVGKAHVADALAEGRGASHIRKTEGGVRIFSKVSFEDDPLGDPAVIDSTPLVVESDWDFVQNARAWVSLNSLKRLSGKFIFVICVVTSSGANDPVHKEPDIFRKEFTWLHLLAYIFQGHQHAIMMLVKVEGTDCSDRTKSGIRDALQRGGFARSNISFETLEVETLRTSVRSALGHSVFHGTSRNNWNTMVPFCLSTVASSAEVVDAHGPWGPDRVILFGPKGSGKSTLARLLTSGRLDPGSQKFHERSGDQRGEGRGWYVVNTPDLIKNTPDFTKLVAGTEPAMWESSVSIIPGATEETLEKSARERARLFWDDPDGAPYCTPEEKIREFGREAEGIFTHVIYVCRKDQVDLYQWNRWRQMFLECFQRYNINWSHSIVLSDADKDWVKRHNPVLQIAFDGCRNILGADFLSVNVSHDRQEEEMEEEFQLFQLISLKVLEDRLAVLSTRPPMFSSEGLFRLEFRLRKLNTLLVRAAIESLKSPLHTGVKGQNIGNSSRGSSWWRPSHRYPGRIALYTSPESIGLVFLTGCKLLAFPTLYFAIPSI